MVELKLVLRLFCFAAWAFCAGMNLTTYLYTRDGFGIFLIVLDIVVCAIYGVSIYFDFIGL